MFLALEPPVHLSYRQCAETDPYIFTELLMKVSCLKLDRKLSLASLVWAAYTFVRKNFLILIFSFLFLFCAIILMLYAMQFSYRLKRSLGDFAVESSAFPLTLQIG